MEYKTTDNVNNFSDHFVVGLPVSYIQKKEKQHTPRSLWDWTTSADLKHYEEILCDKLHHIVVSRSLLHCNNVLCDSKDHHYAMLSLHNSIVGAWEAASIISTPQSGSASTKHNVPGWSEHVAPLKEKALFWHLI